MIHSARIPTVKRADASATSVAPGTPAASSPTQPATSPELAGSREQSTSPSGVVSKHAETPAAVEV